MSNFSGLANAQVYEYGKWSEPGTYDVSIDRVTLKDSVQSGRGFLVEYTIAKSNRADIPPGDCRTWWQSMKNSSIAMSAIKPFIISALGLDIRRDAERITREVLPSIENLAEYVVSPQNPLCGYYLHLEVVAKKTRAGGDFNRHDWESLDFAAWNSSPPDIAGLLQTAALPRNQLPYMAPPGYGAPPPPPVTSYPVDPSGQWMLVNGAWIPNTQPRGAHR